MTEVVDSSGGRRTTYPWLHVFLAKHPTSAMEIEALIRVDILCYDIYRCTGDRISVGIDHFTVPSKWQRHLSGPTGLSRPFFGRGGHE